MQLHRAAFLLCLFPAGTASAQTAAAPQSGDLQSLLTEVRQLRLALERTMSLWPQSQLVLQRVGLQQQHVEAVSRQLEQVRDQSARLASEGSALASMITSAEARLAQEQDERRRRDFEAEVRRLKAALEERTLRDQQQQARESQLAGQLQAEQAKLNELNDRLDGLERMLQAPPGK